MAAPGYLYGLGVAERKARLDESGRPSGMLTFIKALTERQNRYVACIALLAALGGFLFGFDTGVVGSAEPYFSKQLHIGSQKPQVFGKAGTVWLFAGFCLLAVAFTIWKVPETKNRSLEEIEREVADTDADADARHRAGGANPQTA